MSETQTRFRVEGMDCASCASKITNAVRHLPGVKDVSVSVTVGTMTVSHNGAALDAAVLQRVNGLGGYRATLLKGQGALRNADPAQEPGSHHAGGGHSGHHHEVRSSTEAKEGQDHEPVSGVESWWRSRKGRSMVACGLALLGAFVLGKAVPAIALYAFAGAMLVGLVPIGQRAVMAARAGTPFSIEMLMSIAAVGALAIGAGEEGATVVFLFLVGELLEGVAAGKARASIRALTALVPETALLEEAGGTREVPAKSLAVGAVILVRPGDRIAADGEIVDGAGEIDEAPVTGESVPKRKGKGDVVFAGTIATDGALRVRVTAAAADNTIARVVALVEEAQESKAPTERFIDRFATYYTPAVVAAAGLVVIVPPLMFGGAWGEWVYKGLAILLIGCPCALVISTPAAIAAALSSGARRGLLLKGGAVLEALGGITAMTLDKTGTLTEDKPKVTDVVAYGREERDVLSMAAALESGSNHPLALAIVARAKADGVPIPPSADAAETGGKGVAGRVGGVALFLGSPAAAGERTPPSAEQAGRIAALHGEGKSVSVLVAGNAVAGIVGLRDEARADAKAGIDALKALGLKPVMLTGDNRRAAEAIGGALGLPVRAELLPADKLRIVRDMQATGSKVAKVGDGINDAPALAAADVGIAMGGGTDVALETADAAVLHGRVSDLADMITLSRRTMGNIRQNVTIALGLKAVFLVTTIAGLTGLWPAILADTGATVLVTMNAMRLLDVVDWTKH